MPRKSDHPAILSRMTVPHPRLGPWPQPVIPELDPNIRATSLFYLLLRTNLGQPPQIAGTPAGRSLAINMVRLSDKAVLEYDFGRLHAADWTKSVADEKRQPAHYFRAVDRFENCLSALHRTLLHVEAARRLPEAPDVRQLWRALQGMQRRINDMRDAIEHTEERAKSGGLVGHAFIFLDTNAAKMGEQSIAYVDIGRSIHRTYEIVRELLGPFNRKT